MWHITKDIKRATYYASLGGKLFGSFLIILGFLGIFTGIGGAVWYVFIGAFIYFLAGASYKQTIVKEALDKIKVQEVLHKRYKTIKPTTTLSKFVKLCLESDKESFVVKDTKIRGVADLIHVSKFSKDDWPKIKVSQITRPVKPIKPTDSIYRVLEIMQRHQVRTLPVSQKRKIIGIVEASTISNILRISNISIK
jgi:predicted transcriptional regulator